MKSSWMLMIWSLLIQPFSYDILVNFIKTIFEFLSILVFWLLIICYKKTNSLLFTKKMETRKEIQE